MRAADAAGADAVVLTDASVDVHNPKCVRATAGSLFHLPVAPGVRRSPRLCATLRGRAAWCSPRTAAGDVDLDDLQDDAERRGRCCAGRRPGSSATRPGA